MKTARRNHSTHALVHLDEIYAEGAFKVVYKGEYTTGPRKGQECVSKMFKSGSVYEDSFFDKELEVISTSMDIIQAFNDGQYVDKHIYLNEPEIWEFKEGEFEGQKNMVEPFISDFQKFNSNSGWRAGGAEWNKVMQALSHFSYDYSNGNLVLCDLQGGIYRDGAVLTDPVILSSSSSYGPADLGFKGILTFFARHNCNKYCRGDWAKPAGARPFFPMQEGSSMIAHVPIRHSRRPLTHH